MSNPFEAFEIELPDDVSLDQRTQLLAEVASTQGVDQCGKGDTRSLDPASLTLWVTLAGTVVTTVSAAIPVIKQIMALCQSKGIKGAKLVLGNGVVVEVDEISVDDLMKLAAKS
jgi:hypothetical protein